MPLSPVLELGLEAASAFRTPLAVVDAPVAAPVVAAALDTAPVLVASVLAAFDALVAAPVGTNVLDATVLDAPVLAGLAFDVPVSPCRSVAAR